MNTQDQLIEAIKESHWSFLSRLSESDKVRLYYSLLSDDAKDNLIHRLSFDCTYGRDDEAKGAIVKLEPSQNHSGFLRGCVVGILATLALTSVAINLTQSSPQAVKAVTEVQR